MLCRTDATTIRVKGLFWQFVLNKITVITGTKFDTIRF